jgi:hypothetical protein
MENLIPFSVDSFVIQLRDLVNTLTFWQLIVAFLIFIFILHFFMGSSYSQHRH